MAERFVFEHPVVRISEIDVVTPAGPDRFVRIHHPDWVNVIAVTADAQLVLVQQPRSGAGIDTLEIPGGCIEPGEAPEAAAHRELREETGYDGPMAPLGWVWSNPALQTNRTWMYFARPVRRVGESTPDPTEAITRVLEPVSALTAMLDDGRIDHALAVVALERALRRGLF